MLLWSWSAIVAWRPSWRGRRITRSVRCTTQLFLCHFQICVYVSRPVSLLSVSNFSMLDSFLPNSRALLPNFRTNCPDGVSFCPDEITFCPDFHPQPPFFTPPSHTRSGICSYIQHSPTPPHATPFQKPPPSQPRPAPPRARPRRLPPAGVVLSIGKCAPSGLLPPAEHPRESCRANAVERERHRKCDGVNEAACGWRRDAATEKCMSTA